MHARVVTWPDFDAIIELLLRGIAKPHSQALFRELLVTEIIRQAKNARHVTAAHLGCRFADFAIERGVLLDDEHTRTRMLPLNHERRRRARKCATDDHDIVIKIHRR